MSITTQAIIVGFFVVYGFCSFIEDVLTTAYDLWQSYKLNKD